jgi:2-keto-4-pentenoate hydratase/2-oxohepta-3-ene-1,7-dioic acid hydratase in catechol pathway
MKIIRYQKQEESRYRWPMRHAGRAGEPEIRLGCVEGERVYELVGEPFGESTRGRAVAELGAVTLLAPCLPSKIIGLTRNFADRLRETGSQPPPLPTIFLKPPSTVIGPGAIIRLPPQSQRVEFAAALGVVMGQRAYQVTPEEALACVGGYTCANDITAQDLIDADGLWARGKSFDTFCALGPAVVTGLDPAELLITCKINGATRQMSSTHDMLFGVPQIVAFISSIMTLLPGDVILTGTPAGVGQLADGDTVEIEIEGIGVLKNTARLAEAA